MQTGSPGGLSVLMKDTFLVPNWKRSTEGTALKTPKFWSSITSCMCPSTAAGPSEVRRLYPECVNDMTYSVVCVCVCRTLSIRAPAPTWSTPTCWGRLQRCPRPTTTSWFTGSKSKCVLVFAADVAQVSSLFSLLTCYSRPTYPSAEPADFCLVAVSYFTLFPITESEEQAMVCWTDYKALRGKSVIRNRVNNSEYV